jgi:hypothetical protein
MFITGKTHEKFSVKIFDRHINERNLVDACHFVRVTERLYQAYGPRGTDFQQQFIYGCDVPRYVILLCYRVRI